jgi:hypothetical protein
LIIARVETDVKAGRLPKATGIQTCVALTDDERVVVAVTLMNGKEAVYGPFEGAEIAITASDVQLPSIINVADMVNVREAEAHIEAPRKSPAPRWNENGLVH